MTTEERFLPFVRSDVAVLSSPYETVKTVLMSLLVPFRAVATVVCLALYALVCRVASSGLRDEDMSRVYSEPWRVAVMRLGPWLCRLSWLLSLGCWVRSRGDWGMTDARGRRVQVLVSNHVSYMDVNAFMACVEPAPGFVAKRAIFSIPLVRVCARVWGCIAVDREKTNGNGNNNNVAGGSVVDQLRHRADSPGLNQVVVFPEGTTSNGKFLMHFHRGAFVPGVAVKPCYLRYSFTQFNPAYESVLAPYHLFRFLTQFVNYCELVMLPVYNPSEAEKADPLLYAHNVREAISKHSGLPVSESELKDKKDYLEHIRGSSKLD